MCWDAQYELKLRLVHLFDISDWPMKGWVVVDPEGLQSTHSLEGWLQQAVSYIQSLPPN